MKVIIDDRIPYIRQAADQLFDEVVYRPGAEISPADVRDADALIVRTRTRCDERLLGASAVRFIATATIGFDHLDTDYLQRAGIAWTNCPGCNAPSVGQYVRNALFVLNEQGVVDLRHATVGIVGVGHVGHAVAAALKPWCGRILLNDPPRAEQGEAGFLPLDELAAACDVITFHTPLTTAGPHPTWHLADAQFFASLSQQPVIINAARGGVVDEAALLAALDAGTVRAAVIDTWQGEPHIHSQLLERALIATPHIAGYSADGKATATRMALEAVCRHFHLEPTFAIAPPSLPASFQPEADPVQLALQLYNPLDDSRRLKAAPEQFEALRGNYPLRREFYEKPSK